MSILQADAIESRAAEVADWLYSVIDIPPTPHEESTHIGIPHILAEGISKEDYYKYYEPRVVSIGPIHHGNPHVAPMENFKRKALRELAERELKDHNVSIEQVYMSVEQELLNARSYYSESNWTTFTERDWCLMMFLDGCFLMEFISIFTRRRRLNIMKKCHRASMWRDLLLLENQLPSQVLDVLASAFGCDEEFSFHRSTMLMFFQMPLSTLCLPRCLLKPILHEDHPHRQAPAPTHLLQYYRDLWMHALLDYDIVEEEEDRIFEQIHSIVCPPFSVTELKKVNIRCSCETHPSIGIHFKLSMLSGKLFLPQLTIDEWTMALFYNLVAYEYLRSLHNLSFGVTSYLSFMSMLINGEEDVKELRARGVIQVNFKIGDDHVVNFFKDITARIETNPQAFKRIKQQISIYRKSKRLL